LSIDDLGERRIELDGWMDVEKKYLNFNHRSIFEIVAGGKKVQLLSSIKTRFFSHQEILQNEKH
jgi:hypothetical protein